ncbi:hypothetical protein EF405_12825 [Cyclobacteriaceae bacterium YHN15]|nr:hypothetical protein EF405_12825 [Cyclobacteriaceae bacterium YHN15]
MLLASAKSNLALFFFTLIVWGCQQNDSSIQIKQSENRIEINNSKVKAIFEKKDGLVSQTFFAKKKNEWKEVVSGFIPPKEFPKDAVQLFNQDLVDFRYLSNSNLNSIFLEESKSQAKVTLMGQKGSVLIEQVITLSDDNDYFHFSVKIKLEGSPAKLDYALTTFTFNVAHAPEFVHTPGLKFDNEDSKQNRFKLLPGKDQIIGDRAYHAPAIIVQDGSLFAALVPDLNAINKFRVTSPDARRKINIPRNRFSVPIEEDKYTMPTGLDLNIMTGLTNKPVMTFGYMDNIIAHHIRYQRVNDSSMIRILDSNELQYEFDLFVSSDAPENKGFQKITRHQWEKFGKPVFDNRPHLAMPFKEYFNIIDSITFNPIHYENISIDTPLDGYENTGSWLEWEENGVKMGGYRSAIEWWNDVLHNSAFWNNARDAQGFWYWGHELGRPDLIEKGRKIINWCLSAPRNENGLFALLYSANDKKWGLGFTDPVNDKNVFFLKESDSYDVSTMSKTGAHMIDYYLRCEQDERIVEYLIPYGNWLLTVIDDRGTVPSYVDEKNMESSPILYYSAQPSSSMWFLSELYRATGNVRFLNGAKAIAVYLKNEIIPEQNWIDMEQFFSCGHRPLDFQRDRWQNQVARGNLSLFWAIEGFGSLYEATQEKEFLNLGEQCLDYVTFFQCTWEPHYIYTAFPFGGFSSDNADNANYLDARQAEMVKPLIWYGKALGRQDLVERGVAAARSSIVLMNHPRHQSNNIYRHVNIYPFGLGPENIDHEAHPQSAMRTHPSWGEGSGIFTGLSEAGRALGGVYIDFEKDIYVGVDGIQVQKAELIGDGIHLTLKNSLADLTEPWNKVYSTNLIVKGLKKSTYQLRINGNKYGIIFNDSGLEIPLTVQGDEFSF